MLPVSVKLLNKALACLTLIYCSHLTAIKSQAQDGNEQSAKASNSSSAPDKFESLSKERKEFVLLTNAPRPNEAVVSFLKKNLLPVAMVN